MIQERVDNFIKNPKKALLKLSLPIFIGMLVQTLYNIVDTAFVGRLGAEAIAALTFSFPLFFIFISITAGLGAGVTSRVSRYLGELKKKQAENTAIHGLILSIIIAIIVFVLGMLFIEEIFLLFGAEGNVLKLAIDYMAIIFLSIFFMFPVFIFNSIFSAQGDTKTAMKIQASGILLNIILDPIFIFTLKLGVKGAAIATVIAFAFSLLLSIYYIKKKSLLKLSLSFFNYSFDLIKQIMKIGMPAGLMMITMSVNLMFVNRFMAFFGVDYVAATGMAFRLQSLAFMPMFSVSMGLLTLTGMIYGAKKFNLLKEISKYGIKVVVLMGIIAAIIFFLFPFLFLRIFTSDQNLLNLGSNYIRAIVVIYPLVGITIVVSRVLQGMGLGLPGLVINLIRTILISIPLAYLFIFVFGYGYLAVPVAMIIGTIIADVVGLVWLRSSLNKVI